MEYLSNNDFFLKLKPIYKDEEGIVDYVFIECSENFHRVSGTKIEDIINKSISEIVYKYNGILGIQYYYLFNTTSKGRKYEYYNKDLNTWHYISIFKDMSGNLMLNYTDITSLERENEDLKQDITNHNLKIYSYRDRLTELYTKDFFEEELRRLDTERQLPLSIIMGDLNGLKLINDSFGHKMGDNAIKMVGNILKSSFRKEDIISRVGGDEFLILLPNTPNDRARSITETLKKTFDAKTLGFIPLSVSFGEATKENIEEDIEITMKRAEDKMYFVKLEESKEAKLFTIEYIKEKLKKLSFETQSHKNRLEEVSVLMADRLNYSELEKESIKRLCEYHDIGKIGVQHSILLKEGTLSKEEWRQMKRHSEIGYHIIRSANETLAIDELILIHHERWDGKGYPKKLKREQIPQIIRLFSIADAYVAMVEGRPYQNSITHNEAIEEIRREAGIQFDPKLVNVFEEIKNLISFQNHCNV